MVRALIRVLLALGVLSVGASILIGLTGGAGANLNGLRVSAYNPWRPLFAGTVLLALCAALRFVPGGRAALAAAGEWWVGLLKRRSLVRAFRRLADPLILITIAAVIADVLQWWREAPLWLDEQMIAINLRDRTFAGLAGTLWLGQSAPLAWLWIQRVVLLVFGTGELALRCVPLLFGLGTIATAVWIAWRWLTPVAGCIFLVLCWLGSILSHYRFELKHYSADVCFALLLPALAMWAMEAADGRVRLRRQIVWLFVAGVGQWLANGALLVAPGCVVWMLWRHAALRDSRGALRFAAAGSIWLVLFAGHYTLSLRYTHHNSYLRQHWATRVAPADASLTEKLSWVGAQLPELGRDAGGARWPMLFWLVGTGGLITAAARGRGWPYLTAPITAVILAVTGLVPLYERFSLWVIPSLYFGIAILIDAALPPLVRAVRGRRVVPALTAAAATVLAAVVAVDIGERGWNSLETSDPGESNHAMDDRSGVRWLMRQYQPGDAIITTKLGWPAIWWYGGISPGQYSDGRWPGGTVFYEASYGPDRQRCTRLPDALRRHRRALIYVSFPDAGDDFYPMLEREVLRLGSHAALRTFTTETTAAVIRIDQDAPVGTAGVADSGPSVVRGCVDLEPVKRW